MDTKTYITILAGMDLPVRLSQILLAKADDLSPQERKEVVSQARHWLQDRNHRLEQLCTRLETTNSAIQLERQIAAALHHS